MKMELKESGEMYLETILVLSKSQQNVRSLDIARYMHYSKPSISRAMGILRNAKYISVDDSGYITLTNSGREIAEKIYERHLVLSTVLKNLGVDEKAAVEDACRKYEPSVITRHIIRVAQGFNKFYHDEHILVADEKERTAKLLLTRAAMQTIRNGLALLGIKAPERM
jgi:Mn-dependent DtxR family transcriptional regulator